MSMDLTDESTLLQVMPWCRQATSHYLNQWEYTKTSEKILCPKTSHGITRGQWVNSIHTHLLILYHFQNSVESWLIISVTAPSHFLNQCWLIITTVHFSEIHLRVTSKAFMLQNFNYHKMHFKIILFKITVTFSRVQWVKYTGMSE